MRRNSITPSRAFFTIGDLVFRIFGEPSLFGARSFTPIAQDAWGLGIPTTSIRHMRQFPAIDSRSWKQKRGISAPAASQACNSVYSGGTSISLPSTISLVMLLLRRDHVHGVTDADIVDVGLVRILVDPRFDLMTEMRDQALNRPGRRIAQRADGVAFDLLGDFQQHIDLA